MRTNLTSLFTDIADAIRSKKGTSAQISPQDFASEIASIEGDGTVIPTPPTPDIPVIGDGKTYLYIKIAAPGRMTVPLYFYQSVANGVTIDWGDGSATQTLSGTNNVNAFHTYADIGEYTISLNPSSGCTIRLGHTSKNYCVMGSTGTNGRVYCNMLQAVEIGRGASYINDYAFYNCYSLSSVVISDNIQNIGNNAFYNCYSLSSIVIPDSVRKISQFAFCYCYSLSSIYIPNSVTSIGQYSGNTFGYCYSLSNIVIPERVTTINSGDFDSCYSLSSIIIPGSVTTIENFAFQSCYSMAFYDFSQCTSVPTLGGTYVFKNIPSDCKIVVPDALYDEWISATNWSSYASNIVKASEFNS